MILSAFLNARTRHLKYDGLVFSKVKFEKKNVQLWKTCKHYNSVVDQYYLLRMLYMLQLSNRKRQNCKWVQILSSVIT